MMWDYHRLDGGGQDSLQFANDSVVGILRGGRPRARLVPGAHDACSVHLGKNVSELVRALGPATGSTAGTVATELVFADGTTATVSREGIVVRVSK